MKKLLSLLLSVVMLFCLLPLDAAAASAAWDGTVDISWVDNVMLVGAGGGNMFDTVYTGGVDFAYRTIYLTADLDMGGRKGADGTWTDPNRTPIGGKFPIKPAEAAGDCMTLDTRFNGVLDGQGHTISNLYYNRYAVKGFPYSMAVGIVGFLGGNADYANGVSSEKKQKQNLKTAGSQPCATWCWVPAGFTPAAWLAASWAGSAKRRTAL